MKSWCLLSCLLLAACGKPAASPAPAAAGGPPPMPVEVLKISAAPLARDVIALGSLRSEESVIISSELAGRIARIGFREGQTVSAGQVLFELESSVYQAEMDQARAAHALTKRNSDRAAELFTKNLVSAADRDTAAANLDVAAANLALAAARMAKTRISAPFAGTAGLRKVSPGDFISAGQELVNLEDLSTIKLDFRLSESALPIIRVGQSLQVEVDAWGGERFTGQVYAIDPRVADQTRSIGVRARLPNADGRLRPGLFARVKLEVANNSKALVVPEQALFPRGQQLFVYVVVDGKAQLRPVTVGQRIEGRAEVTEGLVDGDVVITAGHQKIFAPDSPVQPLPGPAEAPKTPTASAS